MTLIDAVKKNTAALKDVKQQLVRNCDKLDKTEIAVCTGYEHDQTHPVHPRFNRFNNLSVTPDPIVHHLWEIQVPC